uniref:Coat protein n=1 Tax=Grapevine virus A TaxID=35288 RepID=A0A023J288_9VIRU|nr:coat protein [Grapevine virus A]AHC13429.1 coat protein [Grapevine virus A]
MGQFARRGEIRAVVEELVLARAELSDDTSTQGYDRTMYLNTLFGYIALVGTSKKATHYGEVDIVGPGANKKAGLDPRGKINVGSMVARMRTLSAAVSEGPVRGATLRQMCEPFAQNAYDFLVVMAEMGTYTQLATKMTRSGYKEPQVMFDFASGLDLKTLTLQEATVIQSMHSRLFRTEGAKGVFNAQSSVGEQAVEI